MRESLFKISLDKNKGWENIDLISKENNGDIYFTRQGCVSNTFRSFKSHEEEEEEEEKGN